MAASSASTEPPWPSLVAAWYTVAILLVAYTFGYIDRTIMTILVEPIEADLRIGDTAIGLLHGFAFAIFYVTLGVPLGWISDRTNRKRLICASITLWSLMSASCGLAGSFSQLFITRVGVGIGEAGLSPATYSLIADYFPPERRTAPLGIYQIGIYLGSGLAILAGGLVVALVGQNPTVHAPLLGEIRSWQAVFLIAGLPGLLVAALTATIKEPLRRHAKAIEDSSRVERAATWTHIIAQARIYALHFAGFAFLGTPFNVAVLWARPYLTRHFSVSPSQGAYAVGLVMLGFATTGIVCGSLLADRMQRRGQIDATIRVGCIAGIALLPFTAAFPFMPTFSSALADLAMILFFGAFAIGAAPAALQMITPNRMRGLISALYLLIVNLTAQATGPVITGFLTDYVFHDPRAVGLSVAIVSATAAALACMTLGSLLRPFADTVKAFEAVNAGAAP
jgi:MFS family permease